MIMADFCYDCTIDIFGEEHAKHNDLSHLCKEGEVIVVLCEGCGSIIVNHEGRNVDIIPEKMEKLRKKAEEAQKLFKSSSKTINDYRRLRNTYHKIASYFRKRQLGHILFANYMWKEYEKLNYKIKEMVKEK